MPSWWHTDKRSPHGGYWRCSVREAERNARRVGFQVAGMDCRWRVKAGPNSAIVVALIQTKAAEMLADFAAKQRAEWEAGASQREGELDALEAGRLVIEGEGLAMRLVHPPLPWPS